MNLPVSVEDPSLLHHEPLLSHIAMFEESGTSLEKRQTMSSFIKAMQEDGQATLASKTWISLVFVDAALAGNGSFEVTDGGEALYTAFFQYQLRLCRGLRRRRINEAHKYHTHLLKRGVRAIKLKYHSPNTQRSARGRASEASIKGQLRPHKVSGPSKKHDHQAEIGDQHPHQGGITISSNLGYEFHSTTDNTAIQQEHSFDASPSTGALLSTFSEAAKISKRSTSEKEKKRKPSSQKPPVITPSDASEDDKEPSKTHELTAVNPISHRLKRIAPDLSRRPCELLGVKNEVVKKKSANEPKAIQHRDAGSSQSPPVLSSFRSDNLITCPSKGRGGPGFSFSRRKREERFMNVSHQRSRATFKSRRLRKSNGALPTRPCKRLRLTSMSALDGEPREVPKLIHNVCGSFQGTIIQTSLVTCPLPSESIQEDEHGKSKPRRKRTRPEFETGSMISYENASADSYEPLGTNNRALRPLPRRARNKRLPSDEDTVVCGAPCGAPSLEHADKLLRDVASNALVVLQEGVGPDVSDWTRDREPDVECDDLDGQDQDEANNAQVTATTSTPSVVTPKPPVPARPCIWAQSRQEVCESLEHFRSYHSGVYSKDDIVKGYLLGGHAANRDIFYHDGKLIISHGGGKSESILDSRRGPRRYQSDQDQAASDQSVRALLKTYKDRRPLVLLADDKYALFPYDLTSANYTYVVLGLYWISRAWAECQSARDGSGRIVRWKFTFQWCEGQGDPWWTSHQEIMGVAPNSPPSISNTCSTNDSSHFPNSDGNSDVKCDSCQEQSPFVYKQCWTCLNPLCSSFWNINGEERLDYREEFLTLLPQKFEKLPDITPARVVETPGGITTTFAFSKGWHCIKCGRLSCRYKWEHWECSNCGFKRVVNGRIRSPKEFWNQHPHKEFLHSRIGKDSGILACRLELIDLGAHKGFTNRLTFILPRDRGKIHLILGTPLSNADADNIFRLYQQQASTGELQLRRYPLRNHRARGPLLTNYFSQNSGEPYQYVGGTGNTVPFHEAPDCVLRALRVIRERCSLALCTDIRFNEVLSAAYMERQKMSFHSDSEKGLGPVVASLSLGSAALMHFRPHVNVEDPKSKSTYALTLILRHGDVMIMEGDGVQKYYEHTVVPMNFRIAATARCIGST